MSGLKHGYVRENKLCCLIHGMEWWVSVISRLFAMDDGQMDKTCSDQANGSPSAFKIS